MIRNTFIFLGTFAAGAVAALVVRAAAFKPHAGHATAPAATGEYAPMVSNPLTPAKPAGAHDGHATPAAKPAAAHDGHAAPAPAGATAATPPAPAAAKTDASASDKPVNTVCAICGMEVDPKMPTLEYQGKKIGFGCRMCPPKFKADPDRYGPYYLRNEVVKR